MTDISQLAGGLISTKELAALLGVSSETVRSWVRSGYIPAACVRWFGDRQPHARYRVAQLRALGLIVDVGKAS